jgi:ABC-2 type transport system ATP-binding protein
MTAAPLAQCLDVTRRFGRFTAVSEVNLQVRPGEIVGLLGANGAGKTTLIRLLLGLIRASQGQVALFGEPPSRQTRSRIGYVPQGLGLYADLSPAENMQFSVAVFEPGRHGWSGRPGRPGRPGRAGRPGGDEHGSLPEPLRRYAREQVGSLPLGVQRRVAFAQALSHRPDLLILDEPTSGVDPLGRARLWETIADAAQAGAGVLVTTHYMEEAGECDRLVIMADGKVVAEGTAGQIIGSAQVVVVAAELWSTAFSLLETAGLEVALAGRGLRVPDADPATVRRALGDLPATVQLAPATLEERFFQLAAAGAATKVSS